MLARLHKGLTWRGLDDDLWTYDHIGSTSVSGLRAKRLIDLQIGVASLPQEDSPRGRTGRRRFSASQGVECLISSKFVSTCSGRVVTWPGTQLAGIRTGTDVAAQERSYRESDQAG